MTDKASADKSPLIFEGRAQTVKEKKQFLADYPLCDFSAKETCKKNNLQESVIAKWCNTDKTFKIAYYTLKTANLPFQKVDIVRRKYNFLR